MHRETDPELKYHITSSLRSLKQSTQSVFYERHLQKCVYCVEAAQQYGYKLYSHTPSSPNIDPTHNYCKLLQLITTESLFI